MVAVTAIVVWIVASQVASRRPQRGDRPGFSFANEDRVRPPAEPGAPARPEGPPTSEAQLRALVSSTPGILFTVDRAGVVTAIEGDGRDALGRPRAQAVGWSIEELFPDNPAVLRGIREAIAGTRSQGPATLDGRALIVHYAPLRDPQGGLIGAIALATDVTDVRRAEQTLTEQSRLAEALVDAQSDLGDVVVVNEDGPITYVNQAAEAISGYGQDELIGRTSFCELALPADREAVEQLRARRAPGAVIRFEVTIRTKSGATVDLEMAEIEVSSGERSRIVAIGRDVTERRHAERERQELLGRLLAAEETTRKQIAEDIHDDSIQTLFAAVLRLRMLEQKLTDPQVRAMLEELASTLDHSMEGLRHLLFDLRPTALDSDGLAAALSLYLRGMQDESGIRPYLDDRCIDPPDPDSRVILYRIAQEAFANIRKHSGASRVEVTLRNEAGGVLLEITDDGCGFAASEVPAHRPGHLGLPAMRERAEIARGRLTIRSAPGQGTTVQAWIPGTTGARRAA
ncbi:MAG TPA: PAS domain S-box protein [Candidatus Limnocylindrales bacterium]|nr:PAS domain S-box protein [Candidatus Limnocylindrales bacterium]